ncbi:MAG: FtsQ-type POTRA domain-containing protein [Defluviitaleaceae bacterium]|nr:FtsQ-type POTRA domain-containing protein [Defluviitaleaceae bacterium]
MKSKFDPNFKPKSKPKSKRNVALAATIFAVVFSMLSPFFYMTDITVTGNLQIETAEILQRAGLTENTNIFLFNPMRARSAIMENFFIDQVAFTRSLPGTMEIAIQERFLSGYIEYIGGIFVFIDENGRAIETRSYMPDELPIIIGLRFSQMHLGQFLEVENPEAFNTVVIYSQLLNRHQLTDTVQQIDVSDPTNVRLRIYNIEVQLGDTTNANDKILTLREIINEWPMIREVRGFLDIQQIGTQYIFRSLT